MARRKLVLGDLILARDDPALESMRDQGLFDDLAAHHARGQGEGVHGPVDAEWISPSTVCISYDVCQHASGAHPAHASVRSSPPT